VTTILFFPTMRCQLKCEYCHFKTEAHKIPYTWTGYGKEHSIEREVKAGDVLKFLEPFLPYHIEFSGGEPLLWGGFREFVAGIPDGGRWAITSNTLEPVDDIDFKNCRCWTASCHHDMPRFRDNLAKVRSHIPAAVSFVVHKDLADIEAKAKIGLEYQALGVRVNILRELNPGVIWEPSKEWDAVQDLRVNYRFHVVEDEIPPDYNFKSGFLCYAGQRYLSIMPDGKVYRCYSEAMTGEPIGHASRPLALDAAPHECRRPCFGCAVDYHAHVRKLEA
jgi:MoaA/NifB/PqqE/SkfB family radical SAM enzyme